VGITATNRIPGKRRKKKLEAIPVNLTRLRATRHQKKGGYQKKKEGGFPQKEFSAVKTEKDKSERADSGGGGKVPAL